MFLWCIQVTDTEYCIQGSAKNLYHVHTDIGTCTCPASQKNGSGPCKHQAAIARYFPESEHFHNFGSLKTNQKEQLIYIASGTYA